MSVQQRNRRAEVGNAVSQLLVQSAQRAVVKPERVMALRRTEWIRGFLRSKDMAKSNCSNKSGDTASRLGLVGGAAAGAATGSFLGPIGAAVGAVIGGVAGANAREIAEEMPENGLGAKAKKITANVKAKVRPKIAAEKQLVNKAIAKVTGAKSPSKKSAATM
jgi:phage tail tape-measure protein